MTAAHAPAALFAVFLGLAASQPAVPQTPVDGLEERTLEVDGRERRYFVYEPAAAARHRALLLVLHGSGGNAGRIRALTGGRFERLADEHGFVVAYPEGFEGNWNGCRAAAPFSANRLDVDDTAYLRALVQALGSNGDVYVFGFSGGAHMALRLALEAPDLVRGITAVGANLPVPGGNECRIAPAESPPALLLVNGTADPINPYDGGPVLLPEALGGHDLGTVLSSEETAAWFARRAGADGAPAAGSGPEADGDPATAVSWRRWGPADSAAVLLYRIEGGGHTIPQAGVAFPALVGPHSADIDTPALAVQHFLGAPR